MEEHEKDLARGGTMGDGNDSPTAPTNEPVVIDAAFLRGVVSTTTSYTKGWRDVAARLLWAEEEVSRLRQELAERGRR